MSKAEPNLVELPSPPRATPWLIPEYAIGLLGLCPLVLPALKAVDVDIDLDKPVVIGGVVAASLAIAAGIQIEKWQTWVQVTIGLSLMALACIGPDDLVAHSFSCYLFGGLIALLAAIQVECLNVALVCRERLGWRAPSPAGGLGPRLVYSYEDKHVARPSVLRRSPYARGPDEAA